MMYILLRDMHVGAFGHKVVYAVCINMHRVPTVLEKSLNFGFSLKSP